MKTYIYNIHITFNKTLHIGHLYSLMFADMVYKGLKTTDPKASYLYNRLDLDVSEQFLNFAIFLENSRKTMIESLDPISIGRKYVEFKKSGVTPPQDQLFLRREIVEKNPQNHPIHNILIPEWDKIHSYLFIDNPGFNTFKKYNMSRNSLIQVINESGHILDKTNMSGQVFVDLTQYGIPLRQICGENAYDYNYIFVILRSILSSTTAGDKIILMADQELSLDILIIASVLKDLGYNIQKIITKRIGFDNQKLSTRNGGWEHLSALRLIQKYSTVDRQVLSMALKTYMFFGISNDLNNFKFESLENYIDFCQRFLYKIDLKLNIDPQDLMQAISDERVHVNLQNPNSVMQTIYSKKTSHFVKNALINKIIL